MGFELSVKYPKICLKDEAKFENLMGNIVDRVKGIRSLRCQIQIMEFLMW